MNNPENIFYSQNWVSVPSKMLSGQNIDPDIKHEQSPISEILENRIPVEKKNSLPENLVEMVECKLPDIRKDELIQVNQLEMMAQLQTKVEGKNPQKFFCDWCKKEQISKISYEIGTGSWTWFGFSLFFCPCCACLPFVMKSCQDVKHTCPGCKKEVGRNRFLST